MKYASPQLLALLATDHFRMADLYTISLLSGSVLRLTTADMDIVSGGYTFSSRGPLIKRSKLSWKIGVAVDTMDLTIYPTAADLADGYPFLPAVQYGRFDGAEVEVDRAFMSTWGDVSAGVFKCFAGRVAEIDGTDRSQVAMKVNSHNEILTIQMPRNLYSAGCWLNLFDQACLVDQASYTFGGTVGAGATLSAIPVTGVSQPDGYFDQGWISLQGGLLRCSVKTWAAGVANLLRPLPAPSLPITGDSVTLVAGCDHTLDSCQNKFNNIANIRAFPYVPVPETAY